jgi:hypothetical protein
MEPRIHLRRASWPRGHSVLELCAGPEEILTLVTWTMRQLSLMRMLISSGYSPHLVVYGLVGGSKSLAPFRTMPPTTSLEHGRAR